MLNEQIVVGFLHVFWHAFFFFNKCCLSLRKRTEEKNAQNNVLNFYRRLADRVSF